MNVGEIISKYTSKAEGMRPLEKHKGGGQNNGNSYEIYLFLY